MWTGGELGHADCAHRHFDRALGREWLPSHHTIDSADLAIAATAVCTNARLLTRNVKHFPMFTDLQAPY